MARPAHRARRTGVRTARAARPLRCRPESLPTPAAVPSLLSCRCDDCTGGLADAVDVRFAEPGVQRQGHGLARDALGVRILAFAPAEAAAERAKMQRFVRHAGADAARLHRVA